MSSEDLKTLQRDAFTAIQQLVAQSPSVAASLQMQLAQGQLAGNNALNNGAPQVVGEHHLVFSLADRELAVKAELVQNVERLMELTPVPNVVPWVRGVINMRGSIASVVDLRMFLDLEHLPYTPRTRLLSLQYNEMVICFVVDGVSEMLPIPPTAIIRGNVRQAPIPAWAIPYSTGSALLANRSVVLLDVAQLLFSDKMQRYSVL
ncbi:MAG TPA: chemotaxis protein CheW [Ktedonosporobacter sp.]|nr:chemotaxis protein CheW [Ktedonosporobacter sp.]